MRKKVYRDCALRWINFTGAVASGVVMWYSGKYGTQENMRLNKNVDSGSHKGACTFTVAICTASLALAILLLIITKVCVYTTRLYTTKSKTTVDAIVSEPTTNTTTTTTTPQMTNSETA